MICNYILVAERRDTIPTYKANLSAASLDALLDNLKAYQAKVEDAPRKIVESLADYGKEQIAQGINGIRDKDGNYLAAAGSYVFGEGGAAYMEGDQAAYLEYGTGIAGQGSPHPKADEAGWEYNTGPTISRTGDWSYWDPVKVQYVHTKGIPAQMPVLKAAAAMRRKEAEAGKEALK